MSTAGHTTQFYLNTSASYGTEVDGIKKVTLSLNGAQLDTTDLKDSTGWHTFAQGLKGADIKVEGDVEPADTYQNYIRSKFLDGGTLYARYLRTPSASTGAKGFDAQVNVESYEESVDTEGLVSFSASLKVTGAVAVDS